MEQETLTHYPHIISHRMSFIGISNQSACLIRSYCCNRISNGASVVSLWLGFAKLRLGWSETYQVLMRNTTLTLRRVINCRILI